MIREEWNQTDIHVIDRKRAWSWSDGWSIQGDVAAWEKRELAFIALSEDQLYKIYRLVIKV